jgi:hypothetical protein
MNKFIKKAYAYRLYLGEYEISVRLNTDGTLSVHNHHGYETFCFDFSDRATVNAVGQLLVEASKIKEE